MEVSVYMLMKYEGMNEIIFNDITVLLELFFIIIIKTYTSAVLLL